MQEKKSIQYTEKDIKERMTAGYGVNGTFEGEFDEELAAKCENGTFVARKNGCLAIYRGIPYAKPPVDELRWHAPCAPEANDGVFEAYYNGKSPIQTELTSEQASYYPQGEDCLYLNIWSNLSCKDEKKTVMVFFHGGSYGWGGTADPLYDGAAFVGAHPDILLVTVGYRTGLMGFVDFSSLDGGEYFEDAPNLGILDQIESLRWIQRNIGAFGGDKDNVTIFGESAGGGSVSLLPVIPAAKGLFRRVIAQSGSVALTFSKDECKEFTERLVKAAGTNKMADLMKLSESEIRKINEKVNYYNNYPQRDGRIIPLDPYAPYMNGETADIDMIIGTNANEMNYWIGEVGGIVPFFMTFPVKYETDLKVLSREDKHRAKLFMNKIKGNSKWKMVEFYNELMFRLPAVRQSEGHSKNGGRAYMYYWTEPSTIKFRGACHAVELAYVFGNREETIYTGTAADEWLSAQVQDLWASFARTGEPVSGELSWPCYDCKKRETLVLSRDIRVEKDILSLQRKLLYPLLRYYITPSYTSLDFNVPYVKKTAAVGAAAIAVAATAVGLLIKKLK